MKIEAFGKPCPMPLVLAKKEIDEGNYNFSIEVDNDTAVKNLTRLGKKKGLATVAAEIEGGFIITFSEDGETVLPEAVLSGASTSTSGYSVFIGKDHVGEGDAELGYTLLKMAIFTLSEADHVPSTMLFMNSGVKVLTGEDEQIIVNVNKLIDRGCEILVCGACLDYYHIKESLKVGEVSNMYDILERMQEASKVITL